MRLRPLEDDIPVFIKSQAAVDRSVILHIALLGSPEGNDPFGIIGKGKVHVRNIFPADQPPEFGMVFDRQPGDHRIDDGVVIVIVRVADDDKVAFCDIDFRDLFLKGIAQTAVHACIHHRHLKGFFQQGTVHAESQIGVADQDDLRLRQGRKPLHLVQQGGIVAVEILRHDALSEEEQQRHKKGTQLRQKENR